MADGRNAEWYQVDDDWVVHFMENNDLVYYDGPNGMYIDEYRTRDFDAVQAVVAEWIDNGLVPWVMED